MISNTELNLRKKIFQDFHGIEAKCTCENCLKEHDCEWSWDRYNTSGDCIAVK